MIRSRISRILTLGGALLAAACSEPTLDPADLEASAAKVRAALEEDERARFDEALALVREVQRGGVTGTAEVRLTGLTGAGLLAEAERIELRREIAILLEEISHHEGVMGESDRLARLVVERPRLVTRDGEPPRIEARLTNGVGTPLASGFVRLGVETPPENLLYKTEEYVAFGPPLGSGEERDIELPVSRDFARLFLSTPQARLTARFTSVEGGGDFLLQEPSLDRLETAERELAEARQQLESHRARLGSL